MNTLAVLRSAPSAPRGGISGDTFAKMINLSGRRRFTSQRVVLYTVLAAQNVPDALTTAREALGLFRAAHNALFQESADMPGLFSPALREAYLGPAQGHQRMLDFMELADRTLHAIESGWQRQVPGLLEQLVSSTTQLLVTLNAMTALYEQEAREHAQAMEHKLHSAMGEIRTISKQAQVVAMNARIVAARAGDVGKEFAVVATELISITTHIDTVLHGALGRAA
ncbi:MAG: methyl-accepting chemotaxis protein [Rhodoferax sp.]|nr:MAG: methyl-accepting chemotaxis protein [Rhodoferax sp.]